MLTIPILPCHIQIWYFSKFVTLFSAKIANYYHGNILKSIGIMVYIMKNDTYVWLYKPIV